MPTGELPNGCKYMTKHACLDESKQDLRTPSATVVAMDDGMLHVTIPILTDKIPLEDLEGQRFWLRYFCHVSTGYLGHREFEPIGHSDSFSIRAAAGRPNLTRQDSLEKVFSLGSLETDSIELMTGPDGKVRAGGQVIARLNFKPGGCPSVDGDNFSKVVLCDAQTGGAVDGAEVDIGAADGVQKGGGDTIVITLQVPRSHRLEHGTLASSAAAPAAPSGGAAAPADPGAGDVTGSGCNYELRYRRHTKGSKKSERQFAEAGKSEPFAIHPSVAQEEAPALRVLFDLDMCGSEDGAPMIFKADGKEKVTFHMRAEEGEFPTKGTTECSMVVLARCDEVGGSLPMCDSVDWTEGDGRVGHSSVSGSHYCYASVERGTNSRSGVTLPIDVPAAQHFQCHDLLRTELDEPSSEDEPFFQLRYLEHVSSHWSLYAAGRSLYEQRGASAPFRIRTTAGDKAQRKHAEHEKRMARTDRFLEDPGEFVPFCERGESTSQREDRQWRAKKAMYVGVGEKVIGGIGFIAAPEFAAFKAVKAVKFGAQWGLMSKANELLTGAPDDGLGGQKAAFGAIDGANILLGAGHEGSWNLVKQLMRMNQSAAEEDSAANGRASSPRKALAALSRVPTSSKNVALGLTYEFVNHRRQWLVQPNEEDRHSAPLSFEVLRERQVLRLAPFALTVAYAKTAGEAQRLANSCCGEDGWEVVLAEGIPVEGAVMSGNDQSAPAVLLLAHRAKKRVVIAIRGSVDSGDWMTNLDFVPETVSGGHFVHHGMHGRAQEIAEIFSAPLTRFKEQGFSFDIAGHSLGAGVGALLTFCLHEVQGGIRIEHCVGFATPSCVDPALGELLGSKEHNVASVALGDDAVPRLSPTSATKVLGNCPREGPMPWQATYDMDYAAAEPDAWGIANGTTPLCRRAADGTFVDVMREARGARAGDTGGGAGAAVAVALPGKPMRPPGLIYHIWRHFGQLRISKVDSHVQNMQIAPGRADMDDLSQLSLSSGGHRMLADHAASRYLEAIRALAAGARRDRDGPPLRLQPEWVPAEHGSGADPCSNCRAPCGWDAKVPSFGCHSTFHCRCCGKLVCNDCSKARVQLPAMGIFIASRVCDRCIGSCAHLDGHD